MLVIISFLKMLLMIEMVVSNFSDFVVSFTRVEGNFTLEDVFWSAQIASKPLEDAKAIIDSYKADPDGWIVDSGVLLSKWTSNLAINWLNNQNAATIQIQAQTMVKATGKPEYFGLVRKLLKSKLPLHLMAGEHSKKGWDVPKWVEQLATSYSVFPDCGHLMMAEQPNCLVNL